MQISHYLTQDGHDIFHEWTARLRDIKGLTAIVRRIDRISHQNNLGDHKYCRDGVWELRIDSGPGYRVYYGQDDGEMVLLLCGGDKKTQRKDIDNAVHYWMDHLERKSHEHIKQ